MIHRLKYGYSSQKRNSQTNAKSFPSGIYPRITLRNVHGERQSKTCPHCGGTYPDQGCLIQHINTVHKALIVTCPICEKEYKSKKNLLEHLKIHSERKREFTCNNCQKSFFKMKVLNAHQKIHLGTNKKICPVCDGIYSNVRAHIRIHKTQT